MRVLIEIIAVSGFAIAMIWGNYLAMKIMKDVDRAEPVSTNNFWNKFKPRFSLFKTHKRLFPQSKLRRNYKIATLIGMISILIFGYSQTYLN
jgi:hypothetical protein